MLPSQTKFDSSLRERRSKHKQMVIPNEEPRVTSKKQKKVERSDLYEDLIRNLNPY